AVSFSGAGILNGCLFYKKRSVNSTAMATALLVEDDLASLEALGEFVSRSGFEVCSASTLEKARRELSERRFSLLVTDLCLPDGNALALLGDLEHSGQPLDVVFVTGQATVDTAVEAFRGGAIDY